MVAAAFLMAAGAAATRYGPTLHIHHGLPDSLRGPLHGIDLSMSGTWYLIWFLPLAALALRPYQRVTALALTALAIGLQLPLIFGK